MQTVDGYLIVPMVAKQTVDLAPALVLGAQILFGTLLGIMGLFLADPIVAMIKVALEREAERNAGARDKRKAARTCLSPVHCDRLASASNASPLATPRANCHAKSRCARERRSCGLQGSNASDMKKGNLLP